MSKAVLVTADLMLLEGNFEQALSFYNKAAQNEEEKSKILGLRGFIHCNLVQGNADKAVRYGESYMKLFPNLAKAESTWLYALAFNLKKSDQNKLKEANCSFFESIQLPYDKIQNKKTRIILGTALFQSFLFIKKSLPGNWPKLQLTQKSTTAGS